MDGFARLTDPDKMGHLFKSAGDQSLMIQPAYPYRLRAGSTYETRLFSHA